MNMSPETTVKTAICIGKLLSASSVIEKVSAKHSSHLNGHLKQTPKVSEAP